jgi:biotin carboxyl carrier protein
LTRLKSASRLAAHTAGMSYVVFDPLRGEAIAGGDRVLLAAWKVSEGDHVQAGQTLAEVLVLGERMDVKAPHAGVVEEVLVSAGDLFGPGYPLARLVVF